MHFSPGDILGFSECGLTGAAINLCTLGVPCRGISHVAIVAAHPDWRRPILFESTALCDEPCLFAAERVDGVQAHSIAARVDGYRGRVWRYELAQPLSEFDSGVLTEYLLEQLGCGYDYIGAFRARSAGFGWLERRLWPENLHSLFCSELVAAALRKVGRFDTGNASKWSPNFVCRAAVRRGSHLRPIRVKFPRFKVVQSP